MKKIIYIPLFVFMACINKPAGDLNKGEGCLVIEEYSEVTLEDSGKSEKFDTYLGGFAIDETPTSGPINKEMQTLFVAPALKNTEAYFY